jgi:hypothetical protein
MKRHDLDKDLNMLSTRMDKAFDELNNIIASMDDIDMYYDLEEFSQDTLKNWQEEFEKLVHKLGYCFEDFEGFAFDGDSIRESGDEDETDTFHNDMFEAKK